MIEIKSHIGLISGLAALLLTLSPEARKTVRKLAVKGTETILDLTEMAKDASSAAQRKLHTLTAHQEEKNFAGTERDK
ncbi:MAG: hypothetical protein H7X86_11735 [Gorillibacterium sp.]|nr:hypothetical protein [Gorillibacterium sp.]